MLCAPNLLFNSGLAAQAWSLGSSLASKAAQAALDSPKQDSKHWAFHRANTQQPTGTSQRQGRHSVQLTQFAIFILLASTSRMFCCRLTSLPSSDLWQAINFSSLPESGQSLCVPHPHDEGSRAQHRHRLSPCQLLPSVPQAQPRDRNLLPNGHCSPMSIPPSLSSPATHPLQTLCCFSWKSHLTTVPDSSGQSQPKVKTFLVFLLLLLCNRTSIQSLLCPSTMEPSTSLCLSWKADEGTMKLNSSR